MSHHTDNTTNAGDDLDILLKALGNLIQKAKPRYADRKVIGYTVPVRELERVRSKYRKLSNG